MSKRIYVKLTEEQKNEIVSWGKAGKTTKEIASAFLEKYKTEIAEPKIYYTLTQGGKVPLEKKKEKKEVKKKRNYKKRSKEINSKSTLSDILELFLRTERANEAIFAHLRKKMIVTLWEKHKVLEKEKIPFAVNDGITAEEEKLATEYLKSLI